MTLQELGWNSDFERAFEPYRAEGVEAARVAREDRGRCLILTAAGERLAAPAGRLLHGAQSRADLPAVGDWVVVRSESGGSVVIVAVLPRRSVFSRNVADEVTEAQVVAANVDTVFLIAGLDHDFNPRRIERYLALAFESGAAPVVVLNKADLVGDVEARIAEIEATAFGVPVVAVSAQERFGLEALEPWLKPGQTVALLGSSGVGKSTLVNALLGGERQATTAVRESDSRGRHTTTYRELVPLPAGALLLDTPGMRGLKLWAGDGSLRSTFQDISALAGGCRFTDCKHAHEPGCAVLTAVEQGALDPARLESWRKLQRELRWLERRQDARARATELAKWKAITKSMKHHPKAERWRRR